LFVCRGKYFCGELNSLDKGGDKMTDCIFCKIVAGEIPSKKIYEDEKIIVINDLNPGAPVHVLIIPKEHTENILTASPELLPYIQNKLAEIVKKLGINENGFRIVINTGEDGGQSVKHLHFHVLGGKPLGWPPC
jgi:histidine triad (HIT) family protein